MNDTRDTNETATADDNGGFDPREAAALLEQSRRQARRQFGANPPLLWLIRAVVVTAPDMATPMSTDARPGHPRPRPAAPDGHPGSAARRRHPVLHPPCRTC